VGSPAIHARGVPAPAGAVAMACVLALVADLLFGSRVQGALSAAGNEVELLGDQARLRERLADASAVPASVLVVDLTDEDLDGAAVVEALAQEGRLERMRTLGFYAHVDASARERAERAGFDLVVPRSRMAREGAELVGRLTAPVA
jgi:DNA-binding NarL/FixJ family response regulator